MKAMKVGHKIRERSFMNNSYSHTCIVSNTTGSSGVGSWACTRAISRADATREHCELITLGHGCISVALPIICARTVISVMFKLR